MRNLIIAGLIMVLVGCSSNSTGEYTTVKVKEVEQVGSYSYLLVKAKGPEYWLAVPSMEATPGDTYHYQGGMLMTDFYSKELDRTFDKVLFLEALFSELPLANQNSPLTNQGSQGSQEFSYESMVTIEKSDVNMETVEGTITISELFSNPGAYEGKTIRVNGEVTKYNAAIMELNWVHIQDGTEFEGKFDLTATSIESFEVGTTVTLEGILALNKDFGYGYSYEILLEKATAVH
ncbi:MAG: GW dipeptide domain-containing protein [Bacteroidota bacterium]